MTVGPTTIRSVVLHRVALPLRRRFRTSFGSSAVREALVLQLRTDEAEGWAECAADPEPLYSEEFLDSAELALADHLLPRVAGRPVAVADVAGLLAPVRGHRMAKAALETALLDAQLRAAGTSYGDHLGIHRSRVPAGVSVGIADGVPELLDEVADYLAQGYVRIKLKIEPGWDLEPLTAVRREFGDGLALQVDANAAYDRTDIEHLTRLDGFGLVLVEQPLPEDDLLGHSHLARRLVTPVCLDESIRSLRDAETALHLGACGVVNIKPARVGGHLEARRIHDLAVERGIPVWCGGMLETGIGRAANLALAALPGFVLPGDLSASDRYYETDLTRPFRLENGHLQVPTGPGFGVQVRSEVLDAVTTRRRELQAAR